MVVPACPVLVFLLQTREFGKNHYIPEIYMTILTCILISTFKPDRHSNLADEDVMNRCVTISPPGIEILYCYQSLESFSLCEKGYPKQDEIVHKARCNHIFHSSYILLLAVHSLLSYIRILLFS